MAGEMKAPERGFAYHIPVALYNAYCMKDGEKEPPLFAHTNRGKNDPTVIEYLNKNHMLMKPVTSLVVLTH